MAKMTAMFEMQDRMQAKIDKLTSKLKKMDEQAKGMKDMSFEMRFKDDVTRNATKLKRFLAKDFAKSYAISVGINDKVSRGAQKIANFMEKNMPRSYGLSVNLIDNASRKLNGISRYMDKKLPKAYYTTIDANGKPFEVTVGRLMNYLRRNHFKKYEMVVSAKDTATETVKKAVSFTKKLASKGYSITLNAIDKLTSTAARIGSRIKSSLPSIVNIPVKALNYTASAIGAAKRALFSLPTLFTVTIGAVLGKSFLDATVKSSATFEEYTVSMTHWLKSADKAKDYMKWIGQYSDSTPFASADLMPAAARATGLTKTKEEFQRLMKLSVDMAALTPGKTVSDAMEAIADGQMGEFERLKEFNMKYSKEEMKAGGGFDGLISSAEKKFSGGAKGFSQAYTGMISTLKGYTGSFFRSIGDGFQTAIKPRLTKIIDWLNANQETWQKWKDAAKQAGTEAAAWLGEKFDGFFSYLGKMLDSIKKWQSYGLSINHIFKQVTYQMGQDLNKWLHENGGIDKIKEFFSKAGGALGESINAFITGVLFSSEKVGDEYAKSMGLVEVMASVGGAAAKSFGGAFLEKLDPASIMKQLFVKFLKINWNGLKSIFGKAIGNEELESQGNIWGTLLADGLLLGFALRFKGIRMIMAAGLKPLGKLAGKGMKGLGKATIGKVLPTTMKVDPAKATRSGRYTQEALPGAGKVSKLGGLLNKTGAVGKGIGMVGKVAKRVPIVGTALAATSLIGMNKDNAGGKIGDFAGGVAGMASGGAAGAAIGSVVPGIGTAIGGVVGSVIGGIAGSGLGEKVGQWVQDGPIGKGFSKVKDGASKTIFNGAWWSEKWNETSEGAQKAWASVKSGWSDLTSNIGDKMAPIGAFFSDLWSEISNFFANIGSWIGEKLAPIGDFFSRLGEDIANVFGNIVDWLNQNVWIPMYNSAVDKINFVVGAFVLLWEGIKAVFSPIIQWFANIFGVAWATIQGVWSLATTWFDTTIWQPIILKVQQVGQNIANFFAVAWATIQATWIMVTEWFNMYIWQPITLAVQTVGQSISNFFTVAWATIQATWLTVTEWFNMTIWQPLTLAVQMVGQTIAGFFLVAWATIQGAWAVASEWFNTTIVQPINFAFSVLGTAISGFFSTAWEVIQGVWSGAVGWFNTNVKDPIVGVAEAISGAFEKALGWIEDVIGKGKEAAEWIGDKGKATKDWVTEKYNSFTDFVTQKGEDTTGIHKKDVGKNATGGMITKEQLSWVGEGGKKEFIIPVDQNVGRGKMLLGAAANALGVDMGGQQTTVNNVMQMPPAVTNVQQPSAAAMTTSVTAEAIANPELEAQGATFGTDFATALGSGISATAIPMEAWKNRNINTPMMAMVTNSVAYGSGMVNQFAVGQNMTATGTDAFVNSRVQQPFVAAQGKAAGWGQVLVGNFSSGMTGEGANVEEAAKALAKRVEDAFRAELDIHSPSRVMRRLGQFASIGVVKGLTDVDVKKYAENQAGAIGGAFSSMGAIGGNIQQWLMAAMMATGTPLSWMGPLGVIAQHESGGNPGAVNNWDSNAAKGTPSMGLMQTIMPTFQAHKAAGMNNILNPVDNAAAAINYIKSRYGSVYNVPGIKSMANGGAYRGYRTGGIAEGPQVATLAEKGWKEFIIPTEPGMSARSGMLLNQAANHFGMKLVDQNESINGGTTLAPETVEAATNGTAKSSSGSNSKVVYVNFNGDNHFYNDSDEENFQNKVVQAVEKALDEENNTTGDGPIG